MAVVESRDPTNGDETGSVVKCPVIQEWLKLDAVVDRAAKGHLALAKSKTLTRDTVADNYEILGPLVAEYGTPVAITDILKVVLHAAFCLIVLACVLLIFASTDSKSTTRYPITNEACVQAWERSGTWLADSFIYAGHVGNHYQKVT